MQDNSQLIRVGCLSCPDGMLPEDDFSAQVPGLVAKARLDLLVTSELPFGPWIARDQEFERGRAQEYARLHQKGLAWLQKLPVPIVVSSAASMGTRLLLNQCFVIVDGAVRPGHVKRHLPQEPNWFESAWFERGAAEPTLLDLKGLKLGVLLCTEAMLPEDARSMGGSGADLIVVPRATSEAAMWQHALGMLAVSSGAFVCSANRSNAGFAGSGEMFDPDGQPLPHEDVGGELRTFEIDVRAARRAKATYPRYVLFGGGQSAPTAAERAR